MSLTYVQNMGAGARESHWLWFHLRYLDENKVVQGFEANYKRVMQHLVL